VQLPARLAYSRMFLLADPFQLPLEALQGGRRLISPNCWLTVVAVAGVHQDADVLKFFLDQGEIMTKQSVLLARESVPGGRASMHPAIPPLDAAHRER
jgi:hypothetical protein